MELQIQIWEVVFHAENPHDRRKDINQYYGYRHRARLFFRNPYSCKKVYLDLRYIEVAASVTRVCRIARLATLLRWYRIVEDGKFSEIAYLPERRNLILRIFGGSSMS